MTSSPSLTASLLACRRLCRAWSASGSAGSEVPSAAGCGFAILSSGRVGRSRRPLSVSAVSGQLTDLGVLSSGNGAGSRSGGGRKGDGKPPGGDLCGGGGGGNDLGNADKNMGAEPRSQEEPRFGILFDIDGVIVRGKTVLPFAPGAFRRLVDDSGKFRVPTVFLTNAGNTLRKNKAEQLSDWLGVEVDEDQVVMSHSPLKMFREYHDKHVLVVGQGPVDFIAKNLGFTKVCTITTMRQAFPTLDAVDHKRRRAAPCAFERFFPRIEAVMLFGEPIRWETSLQLILDVLVTDGLPCEAPDAFPKSHLPILACNMDLQWMAEAPMPRFGHGAFLLCLENLYKKLTGRDLVYTGLIGKPSEITYRHGEHVLQEQAQKMGLKQRVKNIYCVGDNVCTDIFGANLYNRYLQKRRKDVADTAAAAAAAAAAAESGGAPSRYEVTRSRSIDHLIGAQGELKGALNCFSVLVETGVYNGDSKESVSLNHSPRDFLPVENSYQEPTYVAKNVAEAVNLIFREERFF